MHRLEALIVCGVKGEDYAVSLPIELVGDIAKLFLPSCVPYLDLYSFIVFLIKVFAGDKVNGNSLLMAHLELAVIDITE